MLSDEYDSCNCQFTRCTVCSEEMKLQLANACKDDDASIDDLNRYSEHGQKTV